METHAKHWDIGRVEVKIAETDFKAQAFRTPGASEECEGGVVLFGTKRVSDIEMVLEKDFKRGRRVAESLPLIQLHCHIIKYVGR